MPPLPIRRTLRLALLLSWCGLVAGCASWQGPRIDPTGEQLFIWQNATPQPIGSAPPPGVTVVAPPGAPILPPPAVVAPPFGNVQAPPVYSDPPGVPIAPAPTVGPPIITTPAPPGAAVIPAIPSAPTPVVPVPMTPHQAFAAPSTITPLGAVVPAGQDRLLVTPERIFAPVCSEVVIKARICGADGYLITNQPINWFLDRCGAGQFGNQNLADAAQFMSWFDAPRQADNWSATGATVNVPVSLNRGTPDPRDDIQVSRGEAWVTVTSATEGTSLVTACAPTARGLNQATATIQWIDADWVFPPSAVVEPGGPHVLTTTVARRTNGAPLAGWLVRYDAAGGASLGYGGTNFVEVPTDADGRASVEVSPTNTGGGTTNVCVTIIGSPSAGADAGARLELGRANANICWSSTASAVPAPTAGAPPTPGVETPEVTPPPPLAPLSGDAPAPSLPPSTPATDPGFSRPPASEPAPAPATSTGTPRLEVSLRRAGLEQVAVGQYTSFDLTISNRGDAPARGILVLDRFDRGLRHPEDKRNEYAIKYSGVRDLPPNESQTIRLTFQVVDAGTHCHEVTVAADGAASVSQRDCVTARQAVLEVSVTGPRRQILGDTAAFSAVVKNVGDVAATNIEVVARCDAALKPTQTEPGYEYLADGGILLRIDRLEPGERRAFRLEAECLTPSNRACTRFNVSADGGVSAGDEACFEVLPLLPGGAPGTAGPGGAAASNLRLTITENKNPARVREKQVVYVNLENTGQQAEQKISVRVLLPQELTPDAAQVQPQSETTILGQEVRFATIAELRPGEKRQYIIPVTPTRAGQVQIRAQIAASSLVTPATVDSNVIEILP